jgi:hypothetical protein
MLSMSENRTGQDDIQAGIASIKAEMAAWASVQNTILEVLEGHTELLGKINRAVQRQDSDEADSLGELLRQIAANGVAHTEGLRRVEVQLAAIAEALSGE